MKNISLKEFYRNKKVLVTGHTGFKGSWMCQSLLELGACLCGYSLEYPTIPALFEMLDLKHHMNSIEGDIRNTESVIRTVKEFKPDVLFHMAAQPIVLESYKNPVYTYETNVMGTVNVMEAIRKCDTVESVVNITTDKVYKNNEWCWGYREDDRLNGYDPYSNSKSCSELVTSSYKNSFFDERELPVSTVRAGNVIGGGDFAADRIIPDAYRAACKNQNVRIRSPYSIRPYQHVLEPVFAYLLLAAKQAQKFEVAGSYNIGPESGNCVTTLEIVTKFCERWGNIKAEYIAVHTAHEAQFLKLDCSKFKQTIGWKPLWGIDEAVDKTVEVYQAIAGGQDVKGKVQEQIGKYMKQYSMTEKENGKDGTEI